MKDGCLRAPLPKPKKFIMTHLEKLAKAYEVENFFDYIIESQVNGNLNQVKELAKKLKRNELVRFTAYALKYYDKYGRATVAYLSQD